jgi:hypothetical protein
MEEQDQLGQGKMKALKEVYAMRPEYASYDFSRFSKHLSSIRSIIKTLNKHLDDDQKVFDTFVANLPVSYTSHKGYIQ